ncbi:FRMD7 protein, partial [Amia calva]|nr:FRMD7 protein [Amia calva]
LGNDFYNKVCGHLKLLEKEYFGLEFRNHTGSYVWLELLKPLAKQVKNINNLLFRFIVKFFPPDPGQLQKELTRYLFALQIKQDLGNGSLTCNDNSAALLVSHILQSELGDFDEELDMQHLESKRYVPNQEYLDNKIMRPVLLSFRGQSPADCDVQLLEVARKLDMYGIRPHPANDGEGMKINLAVTHMGVLVFQGNTKINTFSWAKVRKLSFKRKNFLIKLHAKIVPSRKDTVEFTMASRDVSKAFWKMCVEYHAFFRLSEEPKSRHKSILYSKGSCFRYSGRTQKQLLECVGKGEKKNLPFERKHCKAHYDTRQCRSSPDLLTDVSKQMHSFERPGYSKTSSEKAPQPVLSGKRSQSAVEVVFSAELERSKPEADPAAFSQSRSNSFSSFQAEGQTEGQVGLLQSQRQRMCFARSNSITEVHRSRLITNPQLLRRSDSPGYPLAVEGFVSSASFYLDRPPRLPRHTSLAEDVIRSSSFSSPATISPSGRRHKYRHNGLYQAGVTSCSSRINIGREDTGHFSDDSSYQTALPKRSWSQSDMKFLHPTHSSEFRPLGYYPHLSRRSGMVRHMLPQHGHTDRPNSLCVMDRFGAGTDFSDSDSDSIYPYYYPILGKLVKATPLARMRISSGSLQLDEEE